MAGHVRTGRDAACDGVSHRNLCLIIRVSDHRIERRVDRCYPALFCCLHPSHRARITSIHVRITPPRNKASCAAGRAPLPRVPQLHIVCRTTATKRLSKSETQGPLSWAPNVHRGAARRESAQSLPIHSGSAVYMAGL